ncbi:YhgE/Pip domain-containing protein [Corynebacterium sp. NML180780]|uniref:YhgE/Pip domain-containing protein n=1 Tax=Corynebacterium sp. NML180780 TaxID=2598459 RepID=UPI0011979EE0|nr:YhgE/Pip domain-containing protein [Corynebacterium sp. NML180780]TVX78869.1 YhgE/Pip domain-containing protein [Corynebacterium sp. NML180780]
MSGLHLGSNFRKFLHGKLPPLALIAITLLPLLFGGLFVWSYWDPLGNLNKVPVALVNSDEGENGQQVVDKLLEEKPMNFQVVSADEARQGIADGTYYLGMEIPTDFTEAVTSVKEDNPHQAKINVTLNETNGFIPTMLGGQASRVITDTVSNTVGSKVVDQLFVGFNTINDGMGQAADGAGQLNEGAKKAGEGGQKLDDGATKLDDGMQEFNSKLQQMPSAAHQLDDGVTRLQDGAQQLNTGIGTAADGANQLSEGMLTLQGGTDKLGAGASQVAGGVDKIAGVAGQLGAAQAAFADIDASLNQVIADLDASPIPGTEQIAAQARQTQAQLHGGPLATAMNSDLVSQLQLLQSGAHQVANELQDPNAQYRGGVNRATDAAQQLAAGLAKLQDGSGTLVAGVAQLKDGTSQLVVAANTASDASSKLADGSNQLVVGLGALNDGLVQLDDGTGELSVKLHDAQEQAPTWEGERLNKAVDSASNPVVLNQAGDELTFFGKGLSPFFLSLSLWFGGLVLYMIFEPISRRAIDSGASPVRVALNTLLPSFLVTGVQSVFLWIMQVCILRVEPTHAGVMLAVLVGVSWVFVSFIYMLNCIFGKSIGRLLTMALMSLQLVASNGLYPPEVQPKFIQWVHSWDPMRYSVDLMRYALFGTDGGDPRMIRATLVLLGIAVGSWVVACLGLTRLRQIPERDLHPELSV